MSENLRNAGQTESAWTALANLAGFNAIPISSDEPLVPAHQGIRHGQSGQGFEAFAVKRKGEGGQTTAFGIGEADASTTEFRVENAVFFQDVGDDLLLDTIWGRVQKCVSYFLSVRGPRGLATATTPGGAAAP